MNILFFALYKINDSNSGYIYADLIKEFARQGHNVFAVTPSSSKTECFVDDNNVTIIKVKNGATEKTGKVKKVINLFLLDSRTIRAVKKYVKDIHFDYIIAMSSSLSFYKSMKYFKKKHSAFSYLLLKDIFPQNAIDMGMLKKTGIKGIIYKYFRKKEKKYYTIADKIGCLDNESTKFILKHNSFLPIKKVETCPNSINIKQIFVDDEEKKFLKEKYNLPLNKIIFAYTGNFGVPQGVPFIINCLKKLQNNNNVFFLFVGDGTEYHLLEEFVNTNHPRNICLMKRIPSKDFDKLIYCCDVGLISLDFRFSFSNYPSKMLSYMQASLPILGTTNENSDVKNDIINANLGWWCPSNDVNKFCNLVEQISHEDLTIKRIKSKEYLINNFSTSKSVDIILNKNGD